jgi:hypothetical protein
MFCKSEENLTREHVFPAFMGGELSVADGSCSRCNGEFGTWEAEIGNSIKPLLNVLQVQNRGGVVPKVKGDVTIRGMDAKGLFGIREGDGTVNLQDIVIPTTEPDGKKHRRGLFVSEETAEKFVERAHARGEKTTELSLPQEIVYDFSYLQSLFFVFTLAARKVAGKIALASIALEYGVDYALSPQFDALRQIRTATTENEMPPRVFCNKTFMDAHSRNAHQHSVMCHFSAGKRKGWALVTLFGGLSYIVEVTDKFDEESSKQFSIFYDALAKERITPVVLADEKTLIGKVLSKETVFENPDAIDQQWFPIIAAFCAEAGIPIERVRS